MANIKLGSHVSFKAPNYLEDSIKDSLSYDATAFMIYLGPPQSARRVSHDKLKINQYLFSEYKKIFNQSNIVVHAPYIINLANLKNYNFNVDFLIKEINLMNKFSFKYLVLHPGSKLKLETKDALDLISKALKEIITKTKDVIICLETMAGKGTEACANLDEIKYIIENVSSSRIAICLDTCHLWDSGYDIKNDLEFLIDELKQKKLINLVFVVHVNDSKNDLGSKKDRHANLDKGYIGLAALKKFVHRQEFKNAIFILETPWEDNKPIYKQEIASLLKK